MSDFELTLKPGDRLGVVGANGTGKTTLLRILMGDEKPDTGVLKRSPRLSVGWYRQTHDHLDKTQEVWTYLQMTVPPRANGVRLSEQEARDLAGAFLFSGRAQESLMGSLSGGERARAVLAGLVAGAHNLLILDEPSNHLDIPSAERLEQALSLPPEEGGYDGTLILVTYAEFDAMRVRGESAKTSTNESAKSTTDSPKPQSKPSPVSKAANTNSKTVTVAKAARPRTTSNDRANRADPRNPLSNLPQAELESILHSVNAKLAGIDEQLGDPEVYADRKKTNILLDDRTLVEREKAKYEEEWLRRAAD